MLQNHYCEHRFSMYANLTTTEVPRTYCYQYQYNRIHVLLIRIFFSIIILLFCFFLYCFPCRSTVVFGVWKIRWVVRPFIECVRFPDNYRPSNVVIGDINCLASRQRTRRACMALAAVQTSPTVGTSPQNSVSTSNVNWCNIF